MCCTRPQDVGSAHQAFNPSFKPGELARADRDSKITEAHAHDARGEPEQSQIEHGMRELTRHGYLPVVATLNLAHNGETPGRGRESSPVIERSPTSLVLLRWLAAVCTTTWRILPCSVSSIDAHATKGEAVDSTTNTSLPSTWASFRQSSEIWRALCSQSVYCDGSNRARTLDTAGCMRKLNETDRNASRRQPQRGVALTSQTTNRPEH